MVKSLNILLLGLLGWTALALVIPPNAVLSSPAASSREATVPSGYPLVVIYTLDSCSHCQAAKRFLTERLVPFDNREIGNSPVNLAELTKIYEEMGVPKQARGVPLIIVDGSIRLQGFDKKKLQKILNESAR